jgi:hypothetical protein
MQCTYFAVSRELELTYSLPFNVNVCLVLQLMAQ